MAGFDQKKTKALESLITTTCKKHYNDNEKVAQAVEIAIKLIQEGADPNIVTKSNRNFMRLYVKHVANTTTSTSEALQSIAHTMQTLSVQWCDIDNELLEMFIDRRNNIILPALMLAGLKPYYMETPKSKSSSQVSLKRPATAKDGLLLNDKWYLKFLDFSKDSGLVRDLKRVDYKPKPQLATAIQIIEARYQIKQVTAMLDSLKQSYPALTGVLEMADNPDYKQSDEYKALKEALPQVDMIIALMKSISQYNTQSLGVMSVNNDQKLQEKIALIEGWGEQLAIAKDIAHALVYDLNTQMPEQDLEKETALLRGSNQIFDFYYDLGEKAHEIIQTYQSYLDTLEFAQDAIVLAHKTGVDDKLTIKQNGYEFDQQLGGSDISVTLPSCYSSWQAFQQSDDYQSYCSELESSQTPQAQAVSELIAETFEVGLLPHSDKDFTDNWEQTAKRYLEGKPVIFESIWNEHSAMTVLYKDRIYICNKGRGTDIASIKSFKINNLEAILGNPDLDDRTRMQLVAANIKNMANYERKVHFGAAGDVFQTLSGKQSRFEAAPMLEAMCLERMDTKPVRGQKLGNCSYTNTKRSIDGIMIALMDRADADKASEVYPQQWPEMWHQPQSIDMSFVDRQQNRLYEAFTIYDRVREVQNFCQKYLPTENELDTNPSALNVLLYILRDQCNIDSQRDLEQGKAIVQHLNKLGMSQSDIQQKIDSLPKQNIMARAGGVLRSHQEKKQHKEAGTLTPQTKTFIANKRRLDQSTSKKASAREIFFKRIEKDLNAQQKLRTGLKADKPSAKRQS